MVATPTSVPVPPDSVRVWRGFRLGGLEVDQFFEKLGSIFIPGTVQIQSQVGLTAYLPTVLPKEKHPAAPDEVALVFYEYQAAYEEAKLTVGGRAYSDMHALVFDLKRSLSGFPEKFTGTLAAGGKYYLFDTEVDWQIGAAGVFVGVRPDGTKGADFRKDLAGWLARVQQGGGPDAAIATASEDYVVYWEHWPSEAAAKGSRVEELRRLSQHVHSETIPAEPLPNGLWDRFGGYKITEARSFNFRFDRRKQDWQPANS